MSNPLAHHQAIAGIVNSYDQMLGALCTELAAARKTIAELEKTIAARDARIAELLNPPKPETSA